MFSSYKLWALTFSLIIYILSISPSWATVIGDEYQVDISGVIDGTFPGGGFTQENYITQFELGNGGDGTPNPPVTFGTPHIAAGWIRPASQSSSFLIPGNILIQDSLTPTSINTSTIFFDIQGIENPGPNQIIKSIFTNTLQDNTVNTFGFIGIDIVGVTLDPSLTGNVSVSNLILTLFYDDMSSLDISNNVDVEIISFGINANGDFDFSADIFDPSLFQTSNGLNVTRLTLEATVTTLAEPTHVSVPYPIWLNVIFAVSLLVLGVIFLRKVRSC